MSYRGRASYNRAPNCASRNTKPYIVTDEEGKVCVGDFFPDLEPLRISKHPLGQGGIIRDG